MRDLLIPDLTDTITVDPELLRMRSEVDYLESGLDGLKEKAKAEKGKAAKELTEAAKDLAKNIKQAKAEIKEYEKAKGRKPSITLGYMPASKATSLRNQVIGGSDTKAFRDKADNIAASSRDVLAWAVKGWSLHGKGGPVKFKSARETVCGFEFTKAAPAAVSILERQGWLRVLNMAAWEFNNVSEAEKKR